MKWTEKKRILENWMNNTLKSSSSVDLGHYFVSLRTKIIGRKKMFRAVERRVEDRTHKAFCSSMFKGKWSLTKSGAYDSFLRSLYDTYGCLDRAITRDETMSRCPKTFSEMRLVNAISTGD